MAQLYVEAALLSFEGMSPSGEATVISVPRGRVIEHFRRTGNQAMIDDAWLIPDVCANPAGVWEGLNRSGQSESLCYSGVPTGTFGHEYGRDDLAIEPGFVFLIFMTPELEPSKWRWEREDPHHPGCPEGHEKRFGRRVWPPAQQ